MSSYYKRVANDLEPAKIAKSEDIHDIQTNIQNAFVDFAQDIFGDGCILDDDEDALTLIPNPLHTDQVNKNYDEVEGSFMSFYDIYLKQRINIEKSEIQSITVQMRNDTVLSPTIFAEIRDNDMNLKKEANVVLESTLDSEDPIDVNFIFNLNHLPTGEYYFIIRPVDITLTDLTINGDETMYDEISPEMFSIRYDRGGNYGEDLQSSYNGVDYFDANLLDDDITINNNNFDLYFEHIYSAGNTYTIQPAKCLVNGEPVMPIDTHVTIDGPSATGNRIDLITLNTEGQYEVVSGVPYTGQREEKDYPINTTGFKIAYITTYQNANATWTCPLCNTVNDGHIETCYNCGTTTNSKIPLVEQADDNNITRQRDILERLRRLEKKLNYQVENNSPSRIKYTCVVDPTMIALTHDDQEYGESSYGVSVSSDNTVSTSGNDDIKPLSWSIADKVTTIKTTKTKINARIEAQNVGIPQTKPKKPTSAQYFNVYAYALKTNKTTTVKENKDKTTTSTQSTTKTGISIPLTIYIKNKKGKTLHTISKKTNSSGKIKLDLWQYKNLKKGTYNIITQYENKKLSTTLTVYDGNGTTTTTKKHIDIIISESTPNTISTNVNDGTITGNDSFYTNNMTVDTDKGEVFITKTKTTNPKKIQWRTVSADKVKTLKHSNRSFDIKNSENATNAAYGMLNFEIKNECTIYSITPYIQSFTNIKDFRIILFKNDKIFNLNRSKTSYIKELLTDKAKNTNFPNVYSASWVKIKGASKNGTVKPSKQHTFEIKNGRKLEKGIYSLLIIGRLKEKKKDGKITIKQYHVSNAIKYGAVSTAKGSTNPNKVYFDTYSLTNRTWLVIMDMYKHTYNNTGTLVSQTVDTVKNIQACKIKANYEIPEGGCDVDTYVSNNGGKSYILVGNNINEVRFKGLGHEFRWRIVFHGNSYTTPKLKYSTKMKSAIQFELSTVDNFINYEDYDRCFATPLFNANSITKTMVQNTNVKNEFEEWEYCRLWMEDDDLEADIDICFGYDYDDYDTTVHTKQSKWKKSLFFSQTLSNLNLKDFSQDSIDYNNYNGSVEYDENNFRFKFDEKIFNDTSITIATPLANLRNNQYNYAYGDITDEYTDMSCFEYGLINAPYTYSDNYDEDADEEHDDSNRIYSGTYVISGPYYQAQYKPNNGSKVWAADQNNGDYKEGACIIGIAFEDGLKITDQYTSLQFNIIPNLRDCLEIEKDGENDGLLDLDTGDGKPTLKPGERDDETKYVDDDGYYYIPAGTLEIVASLNPYGLIEDDNATYGKAYPINVPLRSCTHTEVSINLADLYGSTIYSFGIRVSTKKDSNGEPLVRADANGRHPSLHDGDILGLGNIFFQSYNIKPYVPYIYTNDTTRWNWTAMNKNQNSYAAISYATKDKNSLDPNNEHTRYCRLIIPKTNPQNSYDVVQTVLNPNNPNPHDFEWYVRHNITTFYRAKQLPSAAYIKQVKTANSNRIKLMTASNEDGPWTDFRTSTDTANAIVFHLNSADGTGNRFKINTDIDLVPYNWVNIKYNLEIIREIALDKYLQNINNAPADPSNVPSYFSTGTYISKGDIIFDLYDTPNPIGTEPIESFALPAWGKIQDQYGNNQESYVNKTVNAWFKVHSDATTVKCIVLRRENPTGAKMTNIDLVLQDILFLNTDSVPALGPQMHVRIYPTNTNAQTMRNTKIRKVGCVYRIG